MQETINNYSNAFVCEKCPTNNGPDGCPCWTGLIETNVQTGEQRINENCLFRLLPGMLVEVIKASNRPAAEIGAMREGVIESVTKLAQAAIPHAKNTN